MIQLGDFAECAVGLCNVVNLLCPQLVVLGDLFTALPPTLVEHVGNVVRKRSLVSRALGGTQDRDVVTRLGRQTPGRRRTRLRAIDPRAHSSRTRARAGSPALAVIRCRW